MNITSAFEKLRFYCEKEQFKGWDPYDGLNSKVFKVLPIKHWVFARIAWIQIFKRSPLNLRRLFLVPKGYNSKGLALYLTGYCNLYKISKKNNVKLKESQQLLDQINYLAELLISLKSKGYSGDCWGYNFDWQSRAFFLPDKTPTVVATSFVVDALLLAYDCTNNIDYLNSAKSAANFVLKDLNRIPKENGLYMFSYSPLDKRAVYNATLLGTRMLAKLYHYVGSEEFKKAALISAKAVCNVQKEDGSFPHSDQVGDKWMDSFHTGFKLESLAVYKTYCKDDSFDESIERGISFYMNTFFMNDGTPKYYSNSTYPIDLHCPAQLMPTLFYSNYLKDYESEVLKVINWTIKEMQDKDKGYFYFQKTKHFLNKIEYNRWPNAWMFYGMSYWLLHRNNNDKDKRIN